MYKFRCDLRGHTSDVRCLSNINEDVIISGSRDKTCRVWNCLSGVFEPGHVLCDHTDFIASVCTMPPSELYPDGLIITGSNDKSACGYSPKFSNPLFRLQEHSDTVCCVFPALIGNCGLLSSSWDSTVIYWDLVSQVSVFKIPGQGKPVWCVIQMSCGTIVTGSADKVVRTYSGTGEYQKSYYGHSDCVRALYPVSETQFLSCGNDGHVLRWNVLDGTCDLAIDTVHHFLYSVNFLPRLNVTVYCGERSCIYVNSNSGTQVIPVPCTSVWCVTVLPDGDIVAACSDGVIRIFTSDSKQYADDIKLQIYEGEIQSFASIEYANKKDDIRCPYLNELSGPEVLSTAGKISNEVCFVRQGFLAIMYSWSTDRWIESAKRKGTYQYDVSKKKMHNGKAFDFLFPINIDDSQPNLILPLTLGDDILERVIQFMSENNLASSYSETIYNHVANSVKDDFIKASLLESSLECFQSPQGDVNKFFPKSSYINFEKGNINQIVGKLCELSKTFEDSETHVTEDKAETLTKLADIDYQCTTEECKILLDLLSWPPETIFPVLDLLRLAVRNEYFHRHVLTSVNSIENITSPIIFHLQNEKLPINQLMTLKLYCNMFAYEICRRIIVDDFSNIINALNHMEFPSNFSSSLQVAASSLILNLIVTTESAPSRRHDCLKCIMTLINKFNDKEALMRSFVAIGNLISYEGSFFIPKNLVKKLILFSKETNLQGSQAHNCLSVLLTCFQEKLYEDD